MTHHSTPWSHEMVFPGDAATIGRARDFVARQLAAHGLAYLIDDLRLVVSELTTNATVHADSSYCVTLGHAGQTVKLIVSDQSAAAPRPVAADALDTGGRGLSIVDILSSSWGVEPGPGTGKSVWAAFATRP